MQTLSGSVGMLGVNRRFNVCFVRMLLQQHGLSPGPLDDVPLQPDGRIDPRGSTLRRMGAGRQATPHGPAPARSAPVQPRPTGQGGRAINDRIALPLPARASVNIATASIGAGYRTTDAHHFECGATLIQSFRI